MSLDSRGSLTVGSDLRPVVYRGSQVKDPPHTHAQVIATNVGFFRGKPTGAVTLTNREIENECGGA